MSQYLYQRTGGPLQSWRHGAPAPHQYSRSAESRSLGTYVLPPGAPEPLTGLGAILPDMGPAAKMFTAFAILFGALWVAGKVSGSRGGYKSNPGVPLGYRRGGGMGTWRARQKRARRRIRDRYKRRMKEKPKGGHVKAWAHGGPDDDLVMRRNPGRRRRRRPRRAGRVRWNWKVTMTGPGGKRETEYFMYKPTANMKRALGNNGFRNIRVSKS